MKNIFNLGGFANIGGVRTLTLQAIPDIGARGMNVHLTHLAIEMRLDITTAVGGAVTARELYEFMAALNITILGRPLASSINGYDLHMLLGPLGQMSFAMVSEPAAIGAGVANAIRTCRWTIPFADPQFTDPSEGCLPAKLLNEASQIAVQAGAAAIGVLGTVNAAEFTFWALTEDRDSMSIPSLPMYGAADVLRHSTLPGGHYQVLQLIAPAAGFAAADLDTISVRGDDGGVINAVGVDGVISAFVAQKGAWNFGDAARFEDSPGNHPVIPLVFTEGPQGTRLSRLVPAMRGLNLEIMGNAATVHAAWIRREPTIRVAPDALRTLGAGLVDQIRMAPQAGPAGGRNMNPVERQGYLGRLRVLGATTPDALGQLAGRIKLLGALPTPNTSRIQRAASLGRLQATSPLTTGGADTGSGWSIAG